MRSGEVFRGVRRACRSVGGLGVSSTASLSCVYKGGRL